MDTDPRIDPVAIQAIAVDEEARWEGWGETLAAPLATMEDFSPGGEAGQYLKAIENALFAAGMDEDRISDVVAEISEMY